MFNHGDSVHQRPSASRAALTFLLLFALGLAVVPLLIPDNAMPPSLQERNAHQQVR